MREERQPVSTSGRGLGYWEVTSIGVGGMVGGGIFAVLGLSVHLAQGGAPLAFLIAGVVALVTAYSYVHLSVTFPSQGGTVSFLDRAFGAGAVTGSLNILLWISYMVMLSLYAYAFGSYGASLFPAASQALWKHLLITGSIVAISGLNLLRAGLIGAAEDWIVLVKLAILLLFIAVGSAGIDPARLVPATWSPPIQLVAGGMIIFLAYEGFELIANTAHDVRDPQRTLPRAFYSGVGFVILLYVLVAIVTVGTLPVAQIVGARDYALAEAARPAFGPAGFVLIAVTAMLSTASAINATLYGAARLSYVIARDGELPEVLEHRVWGRPVEGLLITAAVTLAIANFADLSSLSTMGSAGFLLIFAAVNVANAVLAERTGSRRGLSLLGAGLCLGALGTLLWQTAQSAPGRLWVLVFMAGTSVAIEVAFRLVTHRTLHLSHQPEHPGAGNHAR
jgi:amino acid transporter